MSRSNLTPFKPGQYVIGKDNLEPITLDLRQEKNQNVSLTIAENLNVDLLIINSFEAQNLSMIVEPYTQLKLQFSLLSGNKNIHIQATLKEQVKVEAALADFTPGKGKIYIQFDLVGRGAYLDWHTAALATLDDDKSYSVNFNHTNFDTYAMMSNYGVTENKSKLRFSGIGHIVQGAKNSKTHQEAKIMVFDADCFGRADPILRIDENEVEASHAATVGKLNEEHLFYLTSRGLSQNEAKRLITLGYLKPIIQYFTDESIQNELSLIIEKGS
jgi:Fe-S cluster assembly scaffold protein SufB